MSKCTWQGCDAPEGTPQLDRNGRPWAHLCEKHTEELLLAISASPGKMMAAWIKAQGGAEAAADAMTRPAR